MCLLSLHCVSVLGLKQTKGGQHHFHHLLGCVEAFLWVFDSMQKVCLSVQDTRWPQAADAILDWLNTLK